MNAKQKDKIRKQQTKTESNLRSTMLCLTCLSNSTPAIQAIHHMSLGVLCYVSDINRIESIRIDVFCLFGIIFNR